MMGNPYLIGTEHIADRLMRAQDLQEGSLPLRDEPAPSRRQVAAVLHALADFTLQQHMLGGDVLVLGGDRLASEYQAPGSLAWAQAVGIGRLFHGVGDELEERAFVAEERERLIAEHEQKMLDQRDDCEDDEPVGEMGYLVDRDGRPIKSTVVRVSPGVYEIVPRPPTGG